VGYSVRSLSDDSVTHSATGVIAARALLLVGAQSLHNTDGAIVYSAGDMAMGARIDNQDGLQGAMQTLRNVGSTIESVGHMQLSVADLRNLNADLRLGTQTTTQTPNQRLIQEESTGRKYDPATLGWDGG
jgi:filamentous hemagglutinin